VAHGNTAEAMTTESVEMIERGFQGVKLKAWRRSRHDVSTVAAVRERIGDKPIIYVDSNGAYNETEARTILPQLAEHNVSFVEDPCIFSSMARMRSMAEHLPIALLGDEFCTSLTAVQQHVEAGAVGAVSIKLRRSGFSESMKIAHLCEAARLPAVIGTDSESRIGALSRGHLRMSIASLAAWPMETHFFEKLADDVFQGDFNADDGRLRVTDAPGFGASIDREKLAKYVF
jgi:L-alanine-DL-glutamate epimerase-like enolase superfamily enzyme